jgi:hypothetical protein
MPNTWPAWNDQTIEQKLDFLHEWLMNTNQALNNLRAATQGLHERLRVVEAVNAQPPTPQTPFDPKS